MDGLFIQQDDFVAVPRVHRVTSDGSRVKKLQDEAII